MQNADFATPSCEMGLTSVAARVTQANVKKSSRRCGPIGWCARFVAAKCAVST